MKKTSYLFMFSCCLLLGSISAKKLTDQCLQGWKKLFNGTDITDWFVKINHHLVGENFGNTFRVEDGMIRISYRPELDSEKWIKSPFIYKPDWSNHFFN